MSVHHHFGLFTAVIIVAVTLLAVIFFVSVCCEKCCRPREPFGCCCKSPAANTAIRPDKKRCCKTPYWRLGRNGLPWYRLCGDCTVTIRNRNCCGSWQRYCCQCCRKKKNTRADENDEKLATFRSANGNTEATVQFPFVVQSRQPELIQQTLSTFQRQLSAGGSHQQMHNENEYDDIESEGHYQSTLV